MRQPEDARHFLLEPVEIPALDLHLGADEAIDDVVEQVFGEPIR